MKRVLVLSPHPDDEAIGCGGTLRGHAASGDAVRVVFLTSGEKGGHGRDASETMRLREREAATAARILGLTRIEFWRQPDGALHATDELAQRLAKLICRFRPHVIYLPHDREMHPDHRAAVRLLRRALRELDGKVRVPNVLMFEIWTPLQKMHHIEDISEHMEVKLRAIRAYKCQNDVVGFDEAFRGLARYRGEMHSWPGGDFAEVFLRLHA